MALRFLRTLVHFSGHLRPAPETYSTVKQASVAFQRTFSSYAPYFQEPVYRPEDIEALYESGEASKLAHMPVKAARNNENASVFFDAELEYFINIVMRMGKKELARGLLQQTFANIKKYQLSKYHQASEEERDTVELNPLNIFHKAIENCRPILQLTPIKRGGAVYQVPVPVTNKRSKFMAVNWLIEAAQLKDRKVHLPETLARELIDASNNQGKVIKKKNDLHRQCEANRAYAHYRWG